MSHVHAFPMHTCSIFNILVIFEMCWNFSDCLSISLSFLFTLVMSTAPKRKSTPSQNPLRSGASSSFDPTPSHIQFNDEVAQKDLSENFSRQGVHSGRQNPINIYDRKNKVKGKSIVRCLKRDNKNRARGSVIEL